VSQNSLSRSLCDIVTHSCTFTDYFKVQGCHLRKLFHPHSMPGDLPLPQFFHQTVFFYKIPTPSTSPSAIDFGNDLVRMRCEVKHCGCSLEGQEEACDGQEDRGCCRELSGGSIQKALLSERMGSFGYREGLLKDLQSLERAFVSSFRLRTI
jgi:hypothetical protein